jgi:hypothetical protein
MVPDHHTVVLTQVASRLQVPLKRLSHLYGLCCENHERQGQVASPGILLHLILTSARESISRATEEGSGIFVQVAFPKPITGQVLSMNDNQVAVGRFYAAEYDNANGSAIKLWE